MAKELRITFKDSESHLYEYIKGKSSPSAFLKDLATIEKKREDLFLNNCYLTTGQVSCINQTNYDAVTKDISDLDISDLDDL